MTFKNSVRLLASNFNVVWKQLLFLCLGVLVVFGISFSIAVPIFDMLSEHGWTTQLKEFLETIYTDPNSVATDFTNLIKNFVILIRDHFTTLAGFYVGAVFSVFFLGQIVKSLCYYTAGEVLNGKMSANAESKYSFKLISSLKKSIPFALLKFVYSLPLFGLYALVLYLYILIAKTTVLAIIMLPVTVALIMVLVAIKMTVFSCMMPTMLNENKHAPKAFSIGLKTVATRFARTFSNALVFNLIIVFVNIFLGVFTLGAGLIITIPASSVFLVLFSLTTYYQAKQKNFYVTESVVVTLK